MKKRVNSLLLILVLMFSLCYNASAVEGPAMPTYEAGWYNPQKISAMKNNSTQMILTTAINGVNTNLYFEFPKEGGIRLHTDSEGYFTPQQLNSIRYTTESSGSVLLKSANINARIKYGDTIWSLEILDENLLVKYSLLSTQMHFGFNNGAITKVKLCGTVHTDEVIYGLGERFNNLNLVGQKPMDLWNLDTAYHQLKDPTEATLSYINVPIIHSNQGYSLFFNSTFGGTADIGYTNSNEYSLEFNGSDFDVYVYAGTPIENIECYTNLTGKPDTLPKWAFEYWSGGATQYWSKLWPDQTDEAGPLKVLQTEIDNYSKMGVTPSVVFAENTPSWFKSFYDLAATKNMRVLGWINPQVNFSDHSLLTATKLRQMLPSLKYQDLPHVKTSAGQYSNDGFIDFTHPNVQVLLETMFEQAFSYGIKGLMIDYGEYLPSNYSFANGMKGEEMHNFYSYWYTKGYRDLFTNEMCDDHVLLARAGCAGSQQWGAIFNGDQGNTFTGLRLAYNGGLNVSASGFSNYGTDIGGVGDVSTDWSSGKKELYVRWLQYATFNPLMRQHGVSSRNAWTYDKEEDFVKLHSIRQNILDLIYSANLKAGKTGEPMVQRMAVAFPEQKDLANVSDQYLFADELLVCPVLEKGARTKKVYFPANEIWIDIWTGEVIEGGVVKTVDAPLNTIPVYIRGGAAAPINVSNDFKIGSQMGDTSYDALLVTPSIKTRTNEYYIDETNSLNLTVKTNDNILTVSAEKKDIERKVIVVQGLKAANVLVGGVRIKKLSDMPSTDSSKGYYVDYENNSTVIFAGGSWSEIEITDPNAIVVKNDYTADFSKNITLDGTWQSYWAKDVKVDSSMISNSVDYSWYNSGNSIVRTNQECYWDGTQTVLLNETEKNTISSTYNVAQLVYTEKEYQNFILNFKFNLSSSSHYDSRILLGFGRNEPSEYATSKDGGFVLEFGRYSGVLFRDSNETVKAANSISFSTNSDVFVTVVVNAWEATVFVNNNLVGSFNLPMDYDGYISVGATKSAGSAIKELNINELNDTPIGDFNGNGSLDIIDFIKLNKYLINMDSEMLSPLDINIDGSSDARDLVHLKKILLGVN